MPRWRVRVFPGAREATLTPWRSRRRREVTEDEAVQRQGELELRQVTREAVARARSAELQAELDEELRRAIDAADAQSEERAVRRARSMIRRMCRQFDLCRMWTLTYAVEGGCHDRRQVVADMETFAREMRARFPEVIWLAVPELHPGGEKHPRTGLPFESHGWHIHVAVSSYIHWRKFNAAWPHGSTDSPVGPDGKKLAGKIDASSTAMYLGKYVAKSLGEGRTHLGQHRYFRPKGVEIEVVDLDEGIGAIVTYEDAHRIAVAYFGGPPSFEWTSDGEDEWEAPPVAWLDFWRRREVAGRKPRRSELGGER